MSEAGNKDSRDEANVKKAMTNLIVVNVGAQISWWEGRIGMAYVI